MRESERVCEIDCVCERGREREKAVVWYSDGVRSDEMQETVGQE